MAFETIMAEVDQLNLAGDRIEGLAAHHLPVSATVEWPSRQAPCAALTKQPELSSSEPVDASYYARVHHTTPQYSESRTDECLVLTTFPF
jgi:hypothetical protein